MGPQPVEGAFSSLQTREEWSKGSLVDTYSKSFGGWIPGKIIDTFVEEYNSVPLELVEVEYGPNGTSSKALTRSNSWIAPAGARVPRTWTFNEGLVRYDQKNDKLIFSVNGKRKATLDRETYEVIINPDFQKRFREVCEVWNMEKKVEVSSASSD